MATDGSYQPAPFPLKGDWRLVAKKFPTPLCSEGRATAAVILIAIAWVVVIAIVFALPPNELVLWTMLLAAAILGLYWRLSARRRFAGPRPGGAVLR
jgi:hypothetical protein